jgi:hypothetical protein
MSKQINRTGDQARQLFADARVIAMEIDAALESLVVGLAGWPAKTPGASPDAARELVECGVGGCERWRPCEVHSPKVTLTGPEALADQGDQARDDLEALTEHVRQLAHHARAAARLTHKWAWSSPSESMVRDALSAIDGDIWCEHCVRFGEHNPREETRKLCTFCRQFARDWKRRPPREIWAARNARNGRIDVTTIERILAKVKAEEKTSRKASA